MLCFCCCASAVSTCFYIYINRMKWIDEIGSSKRIELNIAELNFGWRIKYKITKENNTHTNRERFIDARVLMCVCVRVVLTGSYVSAVTQTKIENFAARLVDRLFFAKHACTKSAERESERTNKRKEKKTRTRQSKRFICVWLASSWLLFKCAMWCDITSCNRRLTRHHDELQ